MGVCSSGFLLERPWQAQVEVHRRREVRLKVPVGASLAQMVLGHQSERPCQLTSSKDLDATVC